MLVFTMYGMDSMEMSFTLNLEEPHMLHRRSFLQLGLAGALVRSLNAMEPLVRKGPPRLIPGLAAYSFRQFFKGELQKRTNPEPTEHAITMIDFIDYCAANGCAGAELTGYFFPKELTDDVLLEIRRHAFLAGVAISGTAIGNTFALPKGEARDKEIALAKTWIDRAALLGAPHIRVFAGAAPKGMDAAESRTLCIEAMEECCDYAGKKGVFLGIENHGGIVAEPAGLLDIVKAVKSPWFGINLDSGNFHTEDPYADLALCAPYAVNVQVKVEIRKRDQKEAEPTDYARVIKILRDANYQGFVTLEYEAKEDAWTAVPRELKKMRDAIGA
jgi:sugar phosphate isomerase/epimerase